MALTDNIAAYWKFDDGSGTTAADATANAQTLTLINTPTWTTGKLSGGLQYTAASSQYSRIPATGFTGAGTYPFSVAGWFKTATKAGYVFLLDYNNFDTQYFGLFLDASGFANLVARNTTSVNITGAVNIADGAFHHFVGVFNSATDRTLYIDGSSVGTSSTSVTNPGVNQIGIGCQYRSSIGGYFNGTIDEFGVWSRQLSSAEVTSLYNGGAGLQYPFSTGKPRSYGVIIP